MTNKFEVKITTAINVTNIINLIDDRIKQLESLCESDSSMDKINCAAELQEIYLERKHLEQVVGNFQISKKKREIVTLSILFCAANLFFFGVSAIATVYLLVQDAKKESKIRNLNEIVANQAVEIEKIDEMHNQFVKDMEIRMNEQQQKFNKLYKIQETFKFIQEIKLLIRKTLYELTSIQNGNIIDSLELDKKIREQELKLLKFDQKFPAIETKLLTSIFSGKIFISDGMAGIELEIPEVDKTNYYQYEIYSIPDANSNKIDLQKQVVIDENNQTQLLDSNEVIKISSNLKLYTNPIKVEANSCIRSILINKTTSNCQTIKYKQEMFLKISDFKLLIYNPYNKTIYLNCSNVIQTKKFKTAFVYLSDGCVLKMSVNTYNAPHIDHLAIKSNFGENHFYPTLHAIKQHEVIDFSKHLIYGEKKSTNVFQSDDSYFMYFIFSLIALFLLFGLLLIIVIYNIYKCCKKSIPIALENSHKIEQHSIDTKGNQKRDANGLRIYES
ncbi:hypothetical protein PVAND_005391 [Polypedilum vanderplanki]|uniref:Uncharacterized protein n=1 Tax=Polypedilum vanderplanki TaxID=319348 RepID=A0A9J6C0Z8_POLVA|nr:hypothetical protein PVAND_005391 [Polypedilum vanderplanki]